MEGGGGEERRKKRKMNRENGMGKKRRVKSGVER